MKRFDISVLGELNSDLILYGLPAELEPEREHLAKGFSLTRSCARAARGASPSSNTKIRQDWN